MNRDDIQKLPERLEQMAMVAALSTPWPESCRQEMRQAAKGIRQLLDENARLHKALRDAFIGWEDDVSGKALTEAQLDSAVEKALAAAAAQERETNG